MKTMYEKITFVIAAAVYLFFHLRGGKTIGEIMAGTVMQLLTTAPYCIGFTYILTRMISYLHHGRKLAWDRVARIFFAVGIFFGFFFALYEHADQAEKEQLRLEQRPSSLTQAALRKHAYMFSEDIQVASLRWAREYLLSPQH
ncbi:hypothetical protein [Candidatus Electronema sp. PJ]|uniref:hypothetical protein n=1 Tax=Candidatus Electronema sp. PJ TaxID=3401572 RepID=UPI003AA8645C